ncbi:MAG: hypothetical protein LBO69_00790 [Ignavibacteria bacterium]|jgi:hypothetical protein|nr:hypothetical protein [Ignavibacteria bacterium]
MYLQKLQSLIQKALPHQDTDAQLQNDMPELTKLLVSIDFVRKFSNNQQNAIYYPFLENVLVKIMEKECRCLDKEERVAILDDAKEIGMKMNDCAKLLESLVCIGIAGKRNGDR